MAAAALLFASLITGCATLDDSREFGPRLRIIGTVQDGGLPHAACSCARCEAARVDPNRRRYVSSMALILPVSRETRGGETSDADREPRAGGERVFLFDATPDVREQLRLLRDARDGPAGRVDRAPVDGVFLTHAHIGHYTGLAFFGFEAVHTRNLPVYCTPRMAHFLRTNGPWSQLVAMENVRLHETAQGQSVALAFDARRADGGASNNEQAGAVVVTPIAVPHRDEYSDTVGFILRRRATGPQRGSTVLFVPDTEPWRNWSPTLTEVLDREQIDVLIVDGTFFSAEELPGRAVSSIGHPLIRDTMDLLESRVSTGELAVYFTHLNHSNPALEPNSGARREIDARGFAVAHEGLEIPL